MSLKKSEIVSIRQYGESLINLIRADQTINDINQLFDALIHWPAILNPNMSESEALSGLYYAKPLDPKISIPVGAAHKIAEIMLYTQPPRNSDEFPLNEFQIAEYIPPHALLVAAAADPRISPLTGQIPSDRSEYVQAAILYGLAGHDNSWYPQTIINHFVLTPDGFNIHVVSRAGSYTYYTQN